MKRWWAAGAVVGGLAALLAWAPAAWLAGAVASATGQRLQLADARGSVWNGSAVVVLTGGIGSRDASALPGRLQWSLGLDGAALALRLRQACCINGELLLRLQVGGGGVQLTLPASSGAVAQWPASWLVGLGTPFNTLEPGGVLALSSRGLVATTVQGRWQIDGGASLVIDGLSSRISTLDTLGSYQLTLVGGQTTNLLLSTLQGPLRLSGNGQWTAGKLRFRGDARADPGTEAALNNLLNIIGRRQGTLAVLSIG